MASLLKTITSIIEEQKAIEDLSYEVEKVLKYYEEHPQYPLDYNKIRTRIQEVNSRLSKLREDLQHMAAGNI
ncbi:MAG: hypothetical protein WCX28_00515 [Bacteriovoracaceae bacterium]|nr:hypothetical protein [Bacteroidota bacterium]